MHSGTSHRILAVAVATILVFSCAGILGSIEKTTSVEGLVTKSDRGAKTMVIKAADGTEHTLHLVERTVVHGGKETEHATEDAGRDTEDAAKQSARATVYYSEEAGHKVAHFFKTT
jgi:ABC-type Fe3+-hydroxamate transport system substrate-binding protein